VPEIGYCQQQLFVVVYCSRNVYNLK
jgi:hypothetical protein